MQPIDSIPLLRELDNDASNCKPVEISISKRDETAHNDVKTIEKAQHYRGIIPIGPREEEL